MTRPSSRQRSSPLAKLLNHVITFKIKDTDNAEYQDSEQCGLAVSIGDVDKVECVRILHEDGLLRQWRTADVLEPKEKPGLDKLGSEDVFDHVNSAAFRGGSKNGRALLESGELEGKTIEVWWEAMHCWYTGDVQNCTQTDHGAVCTVQYVDDDKEDEFDLLSETWRLLGERLPDSSLHSDEPVLMRDKLSGVAVLLTEVTGHRQMRVYIDLPESAAGNIPEVSVTKRCVSIRATAKDEATIRTVIVELPKPCDVSKPVRCVHDMNGRLQLTLRMLVPLAFDA